MSLQLAGWARPPRVGVLVALVGAIAGSAAGLFGAAVVHALAGRSLGGWEAAGAELLLTATPLFALLPWSALAWAAGRRPAVARAIPAAAALWIVFATGVLLLLAAPLAL